MPIPISKLHEVKALSDKGNYDQKTKHLRDLIMAHPNEFFVDSEKDGFSGISHKPSGYRWHLPQTAVPLVLRVNDVLPVEEHEKSAEEMLGLDNRDTTSRFNKDAAPVDNYVRPVAAIKNGELTQVHPDEVEYEAIHPGHAFCEAGHIAPLMGNMKGARSFISMKYSSSQCLPLVNPEAALVDTVDDETGEPYNRTIGKEIGMVHSKTSGTVHSIHNHVVNIIGDDRKMHAEELHHMFPGARKTHRTDTPLVKPGDRVEIDQPIAHSNYVTPDGTMAMGKNLRVAFVPGPHGSTFEDAIAVSQSAANRLTSSHLYGYDIEHKLGVESAKKKYISLFPNKYTNEQLKKIGEDGHALHGAKLNPGDPIILGYHPRNLSTTDTALGNLHKVMRNSYADVTQEWSKPTAGVIADAVKTRSGLSVNVSTEMPMRVGDKLCLSPDHDVLTRAGWKNITSVSLEDYVCSLNPETDEVEYLRPEAIPSYAYEGKMYQVETTQVSMCVTPNHKLYALTRPSSWEYELIQAEEASALLSYGLRDGLEDKSICSVQKADGKWIDYNGSVHCVTLPKNHVFYVRRNGKPHWTGNSGRAGSKGVISSIIPDDKMFHDTDGKPVDILMNPSALIGRVNVNNVYEALLGKVALKTGKPYYLPAFSKESTLDFVQGELDKHGLKSNEDLFDPETKRRIPNVLTGHQYFMKLEHISSDKESGRGADASHDINDQPSKGGFTGGKKLGGLINLSLLSHGSLAVLRDGKLNRGSKNAEMWTRIRNGESLPAPKVPFIFDKFINTMKGAGINVERKGDKFHFMAMTDSDVDELARHEVKSGDTLDQRTQEPVRGGLFDQSVHGADGTQWSKIPLDYPIPSPLMEDPIRSFLGLTKNKYREIIAGRESLNGKTGAEAIEHAVKGLNFAQVDSDARNEIKNGRASKRDEAVKRLNYAVGFQRMKLEPSDLFMTKVPVIPPTYRPITQIGKMMMVSDPNLLYHDLFSSQRALRVNRADLPESELGDEKLAVYDSIKAIQGLGDPVNKETAAKGVKGFIRTISGTSGPKSGLFVSKVIGHAVNTVGRAVAIPDDNLNMDEIGLPEKSAWESFTPFTMGRMVKDGMPSSEAARHIEERTNIARKYLLEEMKHRPVMMTRDPALHRFNIQGFHARLSPSSAISASPLIFKSYGLDSDGDQINYHIPVSDEAVAEIKHKMMPSKNLLSIKTREVHNLPSQEFIAGLSQASSPNKSKPLHIFQSAEEAQQAYNSRIIDIDTPLHIIP